MASTKTSLPSQILEWAYDEDRILVTKNVGHFERFARKRDVHAGLILIEDGDLTRDEQVELVDAAVWLVGAEHGAGRDMVDRALRIWHSGESEFVDIP